MSSLPYLGGVEGISAPKVNFKGLFFAGSFLGRGETQADRGVEQGWCFKTVGGGKKSKSASGGVVGFGGFLSRSVQERLFLKTGMMGGMLFTSISGTGTPADEVRSWWGYIIMSLKKPFLNTQKTLKLTKPKETDFVSWQKQDGTTFRFCRKNFTQVVKF